MAFYELIKKSNQKNAPCGPFGCLRVRVAAGRAGIRPAWGGAQTAAASFAAATPRLGTGRNGGERLFTRYAQTGLQKAQGQGAQGAEKRGVHQVRRSAEARGATLRLGLLRTRQESRSR